MQTSIPENFKTEGKALGTLLETEDVKRFVEILISGISDAMAIIKTKEQPTALVITDLKKEPVLAAIVEYNDNAEGEGQGNWNYYFSFDPADLDGVRRYDIYDPQMCVVLNKRAFEMYRCHFPTPDMASKYATVFATLISELLQINAKEKEEFIVEHDGYFTASAIVEDGKVVKSFLPDGAMKKIIKDDQATEK